MKDRSKERGAGAAAKARKTTAPATAKAAQKVGPRNRPIGVPKPAGAAIPEIGKTGKVERSLPAKRAVGPPAADVAPPSTNTGQDTTDAGEVEPGKGRLKQR